MSENYQIHCDCNEVNAELASNPIVHAYCHCVDCRELLKIPFHYVTAWKPEHFIITKGREKINEFQHPRLHMKRGYCSNCGETIYNENGLGWKVVSQLLISKCMGFLPKNLASDKHFFYEQRVIDIDDSLPKYLRGTDGALYEKV